MVEQLQHVVVPELFKNKRQSSARVWVPNAGSGESAYWVAMVLIEYLDVNRLNCDLRVFATGGDGVDLASARSGVYSHGSVEALAPERLRRYFHPHFNGYQVAQRVRDCVLFSAHDLRTDPPFSQLDLILGERLFADLDVEFVPDLIRVLHYGLVPGGHLLLGSSESPPGLSDFFSPNGQGSGVFKSRTDRSPLLLPGRSPPAFHRRPAQATAPQKGAAGPVSAGQRASAMLLDDYSPPCVVVDRELEVVYSVGKTGRYLRVPEGLPTNDLSQILQPNLQVAVAELVRASLLDEVPHTLQLDVELDGAERALQIVVRPLDDASSSSTQRAIVFLEFPDPRIDQQSSLEQSFASNQRTSVDRMRQQLEQLRGEFRAANQDVLASNEELRSMNEELESANAELEATRDQLRTMNEELETVIDELRNQVFEMERANLDMHSLFNSTQVGAIFLDRRLRIRSFTPAAQDLFSVMTSDCGRPVSDIAQNFRYDTLKEDAERVMLTGTSKEAQIQAGSKRWYAFRMLPYVSQSKSVDGVVLSFTDVTRLRGHEEHANDINRILSKAAELAKSREVGRNLRVSLELCTPSPHVRGNPSDLEQLFVHVLRNTARARPRGTEILMRSEVLPGRVRVFVRDQGSPTAEEELEPFEIDLPIAADAREAGKSSAGQDAYQR